MSEADELRSEVVRLRREFEDFRAKILAFAVLLFLGALGTKLFG